MTIVLVLNTVLFGLLALAWKNSNWLNFSIKLVLVLGFLANSFLVLESFGYLVKV